MAHAFNSTLTMLRHLALAQPRVAVGGGGLVALVAVQLIIATLAGGPL